MAKRRKKAKKKTKKKKAKRRRKKTIAEGFNYLYYFEKAAETYLTALSTNKELNIVSDEVAEKTAQETANYPIDLAKLHLDQIKVILDKEEPEYKN